MTPGEVAAWGAVIFGVILAGFIVVAMGLMLFMPLGRGRDTLDDLEAKILEKQMRKQLKED